MLLWEAIVLIVLISAVAGVLNTYLKQRRSGAVPADTGALRAQDEIKELKARIQVLERVITDNHGSHQLDHEIERLRDR